jgi:hypothetical protein
MEAVDAPTFFPGCCAVCRGGAGPFVDTQRVNAMDERLYLCAQCVRDVAGLLGFVDAATVAKLEEAMKQAAHDNEVTAAERFEAYAEAKECKLELQELRSAVRFTLLNGVAVERDGTWKLKPQPGHPNPGIKVHEKDASGD